MITFHFHTNIDGRRFVTPVQAPTIRAAKAALLASLRDGETVEFIRS